jgi:hypothetical protein
VSAALEAWQALIERGCLCSGDTPHACALHGPRDNRGIAAWFKAGMPAGFPMKARCAICRNSDCLLYPNVELDDPQRSGQSRPTLVCPTCSVPVVERALVADAEQFGYALNSRRIFGAAEMAS